MKKYYVSIIIAQSVIILMSLVYAYVQRSQAIKYKEQAITTQRLAEEQEMHALMAQQEAVKQVQIAQQRAQECMNSK